MCDVRDDSLCAAGARHVAYLVPEKCGVLESVMSDYSSNRMNMCVCNLSMLWDDLMMDVSRKGGRCTNVPHNSFGS